VCYQRLWARHADLRCLCAHIGVDVAAACSHVELVDGKHMLHCHEAHVVLLLAKHGPGAWSADRGQEGHSKV
jgi:hypothetical protein